MLVGAEDLGHGVLELLQVHAARGSLLDLVGAAGALLHPDVLGLVSVELALQLLQVLQLDLLLQTHVVLLVEAARDR